LSAYELDQLEIVEDDADQQSVAATAASHAKDSWHSSDEESEHFSDDDNDEMSSIDSVQPKFPIGTRFVKVRMSK
jgi:hypothetical protein